jgi:uncharacterized membrane protein/predicted DsbA family dithiol-disulfide isomerase
MTENTKLGTWATLGSLVPPLAGLVASVALAFDYLRPVPVFCSEQGGCAALRETPLASMFGVPTPLVGLAGFLGLGVVALLAGRRARVVQVVLATGAALVGAVLLAGQWAYGQFCPYCAVADVSAIVSAFVAWWRFVAASGARPPRFVSYAGAGSLVAAMLLPVVVGRYLGARVPDVIHAEMARTPAGQVTVVDFVDFECPYCRMTNAILEPLLDAHRDRVRVVRKQVPLRSHPHALDAAHAACCGELLGKGDAMASALFSAPVDDLTPGGCEKIAASVGLPLDQYRACVVDPKTSDRIESDRATFGAAGGFALPTIWFDGQQLVGAQPKEEIEKALGDALASHG